MGVIYCIFYDISDFSVICRRLVTFVLFACDFSVIFVCDSYVISRKMNEKISDLPLGRVYKS